MRKKPHQNPKPSVPLEDNLVVYCEGRLPPDELHPGDLIFYRDLIFVAGDIRGEHKTTVTRISKSPRVIELADGHSFSPDDKLQRLETTDPKTGERKDIRNVSLSRPLSSFKLFDGETEMYQAVINTRLDAARNFTNFRMNLSSNALPNGANRDSKNEVTGDVNDSNYHYIAKGLSKFRVQETARFNEGSLYETNIAQECI